MIRINLIPETLMENSDLTDMECSNINTDRAISGNTAAKQEMAGELLAQGLTEAAVCRILHISPGEIPKDEVF
jgi:hypothetical protein